MDEFQISTRGRLRIIMLRSTDSLYSSINICAYILRQLGSTEQFVFIEGPRMEFVYPNQKSEGVGLSPFPFSFFSFLGGAVYRNR